MLHDVFIAVAFIAMVMAPAMVATLGGKKEYEPAPEPETGSPFRVAVPAEKFIRPHSTQFIVPPELAAGKAAPPPPTLPIRARGMMNR